MIRAVFASKPCFSELRADISFPRVVLGPVEWDAFLRLASLLRSDADCFFAPFSGEGWAGGFGEFCADDSSVAEFSVDGWSSEFDEFSDDIEIWRSCRVAAVNVSAKRARGKRVIIYIAEELREELELRRADLITIVTAERGQLSSSPSLLFLFGARTSGNTSIKIFRFAAASTAAKAEWNAVVAENVWVISTEFIADCTRDCCKPAAGSDFFGRPLLIVPCLIPWSPILFRSVTIRKVIRPRAKRRRLHTTVRRTILSYYSQEEAAKVIAAAKKRGMTISNFVASAALREADRVDRVSSHHSKR
jgi:hypothetical protein